MLLLLLYFSCGIYSNSIKIIEVNFKDISILLKLDRQKDWQRVSYFSEKNNDQSICSNEAVLYRVVKGKTKKGQA